MSPENRNRLLAVGALVVAGGALAAIAWGNIGENLVYYWTPGEMLSQGEKAYGPTIRLGGVVAPKSIVWTDDKQHLAFEVADQKDGTGPKVKVASDQVPPQMFREGIGVVVEGTYAADGVFRTNRLMVSHSNEYRPPKPGEHTKEWQKSLETASK
ncbi:MAG: cytochrome c maturation protein CcmE [Myxococcaceae bacterium]|nr:cytochrome c maturation protein CcmE [Myxococcaceae bacterium]